MRTIEIQEKHNEDAIKRADREETVRRIANIKQYERDKLMDKLTEGRARAEKVKYDV